MGQSLGIYVYQSNIVPQREASVGMKFFLIFCFVPETRRILRRTPIQSKKTPLVDNHHPLFCPRFALEGPHSTH